MTHVPVGSGGKAEEVRGWKVLFIYWGQGAERHKHKLNKWIKVRVGTCPDPCVMKGRVSLTQPSTSEGQSDKYKENTDLAWTTWWGKQSTWLQLSVVSNITEPDRWAQGRPWKNTDSTMMTRIFFLIFNYFWSFKFLFVLFYLKCWNPS